jgi:hypothetical protein
MSSTFDDFTRRTAALLDRRSLLGGGSAALLTAASTPLATEAAKKKNRKGCKKRGRLCREEFIENCSDSDVDNTGGCTRAIKKCCKKASTCKVKSIDRIFDQCFDVLCRFKENC